MASSVNAKGSIPNIPTKSLKGVEVAGSVLEYIPQESAEHYRIVPIRVKDGVLEVGAIDPNDLEARDALNFISSRISMPYKLFLISENDFALMLEKYKGLSGEVTKALSELESELLPSAFPKAKDEEKEKKEELSETKIVEDAPVSPLYFS